MITLSSSVFTGLLELEVTQSSSGENIYIVELNDSNGKKLHDLVEDFYDQKVKITIEVI